MVATEPIRRKLHLDLPPQPTDTSCGPTCLHALYRYYGDDALSIEQIISEVKTVEGGGTVAVNLANHALKRGYKATLYTYNLRVFDPTWFNPVKVDMRDRLKQSLAARRSTKTRDVIHSYMDFLELGGVVEWEDLTGYLIRKFLTKDIPILTGLSSTYLYQESRVVQETNKHDDVLGTPDGHFVVLCGYDREKKEVLVADPWTRNPYSAERYYHVPMGRLITSILLGVLTFDGNLLVIHPTNRNE